MKLKLYLSCVIVRVLGVTTYLVRDGIVQVGIHVLEYYSIYMCRKAKETGP
jgi:hypothetical protein